MNLSKDNANLLFAHSNEFRKFATRDPTIIKSIRKTASNPLIRAIQLGDVITTGGLNNDILTAENIRNIDKRINREKNVMTGAGFADDLDNALGKIGTGMLHALPTILPIVLSTL